MPLAFKRFAPLLMILLMAGCAPKNDADDAMDADSAAVVQAGQDLDSRMDRRMEEVNQDIQQLDAKLATLPEEAREEVREALEDAREKRDRISVLRDTLRQSADEGVIAEAREDLAEEYRELDRLLTKAHLEAAETKEEFRAELNDEMTELDRRIERMELQRPNINAPELEGFEREVSSLKDEREAFRQRMNELDNATEEGWRDLKRNLSEGWDKVEQAYYDIDVPEELEVHF